MFELIFLGTSASTPSVHRGLSSQVVLYRQHRFMIDAGEGSQRQLLTSGLGFKRLNKILLTHGHLDHILGLGGLVSTLARWEMMEELEIFGGKSALERVEALIYQVALRGAKPAIDIKLTPLEAGMTLFEDKQMSVRTFPVSHRGSDCFGFVFEERERRPFLPDKADALSVPAGPERGKLAQGETISLSDGRKISPDDVLGEPIPGVKYVHIGDIGDLKGIQGYCQNAAALVIEATYLRDDAGMARQFGHITTHQAARLAQEANVKSLIVTHLSRRYFERDVKRETRSIFPGAFVARDFDHFQINRRGAERISRRKSSSAQPENHSM